MTWLRTFECPQCGMPFVYRSVAKGGSFAAVDHQLWLETCLDEYVERDGSDGEPQHALEYASKCCTYVQEAAEAAAGTYRGIAD